ncbi:MAG: beta-1,6-N-acetylglucosaminyltransferase [Dysgonamonadaceae bacterium]|jgi:hypothetical protein|nr:beta-1,6-N-acetylglucosaminyltransferase [Dysgonamonadaceae bacterium]
MKIAILILAHSNPNQLKMLIDSLKQDFSVFVHIDAKSDISPDFFEKDRNVFIIKKYKVYWADISIVHSTIELMYAAYNDGCEYFVLISGLDLPVKTGEGIKEIIANNPKQNFFYYEQLPRSVWPLNGGWDRLEYYWDILKNKKHPTIKNRIFGISRRICKVLKIKRKLYPIIYYGGSEWFNLSRQTVRYILDFLEKNPDYIKSFEHTYAPDEIFFQTIIMNSKYASTVVNDDKRYVDWVSGPDYPRTLTIDDYDKMMSWDAFFARKFDEKVDNKIINSIIQKWHEN